MFHWYLGILRLVRFETFVREGFLSGEHVVSIFNFEKAYDTTRKCRIKKEFK